jgi:hypothetical protein
MQTKNLLTLVCITLCTIKINAQPPNSSTQQYIEGAKVVVDVLNLFKKQKTTTHTQNNNGEKCNYCLYNSDTVNKIKVKLIYKEAPTDTLDMILKPNSKECSLGIKCGIYSCTIFDAQNNIINKGDIFIDDKIGLKVK